MIFFCYLCGLNFKSIDSGSNKDFTIDFGTDTLGNRT